ncbi:MAG: DUF692 domain-containing protein [Myxococcales bacterium]|nr:DUF692 domain-containing protein [Myxococcales bacterium]
MGYRQKHAIPDLGVGVGFRVPHFTHVLGERPPMDWFEIISENFMVRGGRPIANLGRLLETYPVVPHGVSLSIGGTNPLDRDYLAKLKKLVEWLEPPWCSDHLCWGGTGSVNIHDLLPLPQNRKVVEHVADRVKKVQDHLGIPFALENVSSYMSYRESDMPEWELVAEVAERADCGILFDVNNVFVSAHNHGFDPNLYIDAIPVDRVVQIHLAGHTDKGRYILDTHSDFVRDEVWALYARAIRRAGAVSTLIEWDDEIPEWDVLSAEAAKARELRRATLAEAPGAEARP